MCVALLSICIAVQYSSYATLVEMRQGRGIPVTGVTDDCELPSGYGNKTGS